jgi:hypothetical protein
MPDDNRAPQLESQENIFEPEIDADQRRLAVRYDALRAALGKTGRFYNRQVPLILPPPVLSLEPDAEWQRRFGRNRGPRRVRLTFARDIPDASRVTLWNASDQMVDTFPFQLERDDVVDPGPGGTVELRNRRSVTFMVGVPVRVTRIHPSPMLHLEPDEEWRARTRREPAPRRARLTFADHIAEAAVVTLRDSAGAEVDSFPFQRQREQVVDPGPDGTVELCNVHGLMFLAGVPERVDQSGASDDPTEE